MDSHHPRPQTTSSSMTSSLPPHTNVIPTRNDQPQWLRWWVHRVLGSEGRLRDPLGWQQQQQQQHQLLVFLPGLRLEQVTTVDHSTMLGPLRHRGDYSPTPTIIATLPRPAQPSRRHCYHHLHLLRMVARWIPIGTPNVPNCSNSYKIRRNNSGP